MTRHYHDIGGGADLVLPRRRHAAALLSSGSLRLMLLGVALNLAYTGCANCATTAMSANSAIPGASTVRPSSASLSSSRGWGLMSPPRPSSRPGSARATMPVCVDVWRAVKRCKH